MTTKKINDNTKATSVTRQRLGVEAEMGKGGLKSFYFSPYLLPPPPRGGFSQQITLSALHCVYQ